jgi:hypothetical protein
MKSNFIGYEPYPRKSPLRFWVLSVLNVIACCATGVALERSTGGAEASIFLLFNLLGILTSLLVAAPNYREMVEAGVAYLIEILQKGGAQKIADWGIQVEGVEEVLSFMYGKEFKPSSKDYFLIDDVTITLILSGKTYVSTYDELFWPLLELKYAEEEELPRWASKKVDSVEVFLQKVAAQLRLEDKL